VIPDVAPNLADNPYEAPSVEIPPSTPSASVISPMRWAYGAVGVHCVAVGVSAAFAYCDAHGVAIFYGPVGVVFLAALLAWQVCPIIVLAQAVRWRRWPLVVACLIEGVLWYAQYEVLFATIQ
jgi:hypothetical protein